MGRFSYRNAGLAAGAASGIIFTLVMFGLRALFGATTLPELLQSIVLTSLPGAWQSFIIDTFEHAAKPMLFVILVTGQLLAAGALGIGYAAIVRRLTRQDSPRMARLVPLGLAYAAVIWLFSLALIWLARTPRLGLALMPDTIGAGAALLLAHLVYGSSLALIYRRLAFAPAPSEAVPATDSGRRQFVAWIALGSIGLLLGGGLWRLISQGASTATRGAADVSPALATGGASPSVSAQPGEFITEGIMPDAVRGASQETTPNGDFYVVSKNFIDPTVKAAGWSLKFTGLVDSPFQLDYDQLQALPSIDQYATLTCISNEVGGDLISNARWTGVPLKDLLDRAGLKPGVKNIVFTAVDGYTDSIPIDRALRPATLVAYKMNGVPLPDGHGFPARIIVPGLYGIKNVKWVTEVKPVDADYEGFWQERGWTNVGVIKSESRIDTAGPLSLKEGVVMAGIAFAGDRGIEKVEVSTDGGKTWHDAKAKDPLSPYTWVLWGVKWLPSATGAYSIQVRATDKTGAVQIKEKAAPFPDGSSGYDQLQLKVFS